MMIYINPFHNHDNPYSRESYDDRATVKTEYKGYLIIERSERHGIVWDVVKDNVIVSQRAGLNGAKAFIDERVIPKDGYNIDGLIGAYRATAYALMRRLKFDYVRDINGGVYTINELKEAII
jgi:hypothetical protein